jgi:glucose-6-phosphate isomerase
MTDERIAEIQSYADIIRTQSDVLIVCGIGGSYLGARALIEACFGDSDSKTEVVFL